MAESSGESRSLVFSRSLLVAGVGRGGASGNMGRICSDAGRDPARIRGKTEAAKGRNALLAAGSGLAPTAAVKRRRYSRVRYSSRIRALSLAWKAASSLVASQSATEEVKCAVAAASHLDC